MSIRKDINMNKPSISKSIQNLYHIRKNDLKNMISEFPEDMNITVNSIQKNFPWEADEIFHNYGISTLMELAEYLQEGGTIKTLNELTKGSTSQYEANYKLEQFFTEKYLDEELDIDEELNNDEDEDFLNFINALASQNDANAQIDVEDPLFVLGNSEEMVRASTVLQFMDPRTFHDAKAEAFTQLVWGVNALDEISTDYTGTIMESLMKQIPGKYRNGIITMIAQNGSFVGDASFAINYEEDVISYSGAVIPAIFEFPLILQDYVITLRIFNEDRNIDIIQPGGTEINVPRKYIASWVSESGTHFHGIESEDISDAYSFDPRTGDLLVPEEGIDFLSTECINIIEESEYDSE